MTYDFDWYQYYGHSRHYSASTPHSDLTRLQYYYYLVDFANDACCCCCWYYGYYYSIDGRNEYEMFRYHSVSKNSIVSVVVVVQRMNVVRKRRLMIRMAFVVPKRNEVSPHFGVPAVVVVVVVIVTQYLLFLQLYWLQQQQS